MESEYARLMKLDVSFNSFLYLRDIDHYQTAKYLAMELFFPLKWGDLQLTFRCDPRNTFLNRIGCYTTVFVLSVILFVCAKGVIRIAKKAGKAQEVPPKVFRS